MYLKVYIIVMMVVCLGVAHQSFGGSEGGFGAGNGGDGVVCKASNGTQSVELLDLYEARQLNMELSEEFKSGSRAEVIAKFLNKFSKFYTPYPYSSYVNLFEYTKNRLTEINESIAALEDTASIQNELVQFTSDNLADIPDSYHVSYPNNCEVKQLVIRRSTLFPGQARFVVQYSLWHAMSPTQQAALLAHEVLYEYSILNNKATNSVFTRYFNGALFSSFVKNDQTYAEIALSSNFFHGIPQHLRESGEPNYPWRLAQDSLADYVYMTVFLGGKELKIGRCVFNVYQSRMPSVENKRIFKYGILDENGELLVISKKKYTNTNYKFSFYYDIMTKIWLPVIAADLEAGKCKL